MIRNQSMFKRPIQCLSYNAFANICMLCCVAIALQAMSTFGLTLQALGHHHEDASLVSSDGDHDHSSIAHHTHASKADSARNTAQWADSQAHEQFGELDDETGAGSNPSGSSLASIAEYTKHSLPPSLSFERPNENGTPALESRLVRLERPPRLAT